MDQISSSTPLTTTPNNRQGRRVSQTSGYKMRGARAIGQQRTNRMHRSRNLIIIECHDRIATQAMRHQRVNSGGRTMSLTISAFRGLYAITDPRGESILDTTSATSSALA